MNPKVIVAAVGIIVVLLLGGVFLINKPTKKAELERPDSHKISFEDATVTLVEFGDYQCPACGSYYKVDKQVLKDFDGKLNFVFRNYPLPSHKNSRLAAQVAEAANDQIKFWEMYDLLYENQNAWSDTDKPMNIFNDYAQKLGLNLDKFTASVYSKANLDRINQDIADGAGLGVNSTPTFFLNGEKLQNPDNLENFEILVKAALLKAPAEYHIHIDFKVYKNGQAVDFSKSPENSEAIHVHDNNGDLLHIHKKGTKLGEFFKSINFDIQNLKLVVNGKPIDNLENYEPQDLDQILISDGAETGSVTDTACIYSLKCPERGKPPSEKCVGGLGTDCD